MAENGIWGGWSVWSIWFGWLVGGTEAEDGLSGESGLFAL